MSAFFELLKGILDLVAAFWQQLAALLGITP